MGKRFEYYSKSVCVYKYFAKSTCRDNQRRRCAFKRRSRIMSIYMRKLLFLFVIKIKYRHVHIDRFNAKRLSKLVSTALQKLCLLVRADTPVHFMRL